MIPAFSGLKRGDLPFVVVEPSGDTSRATDTVNLQAALDSAAGKPIVLIPGKYWLNAITMPNWASIQSYGFQPGVSGSGRHAELNFNLASGTAITAGVAPKLRGLILSNAAASFDEGTETLSGTTAVAVSAPDNFVYEELQFIAWYKCIKTGTSTYYGKTSKIIFNRCYIGYDGTAGSVYNLDIVLPNSVLTRYFFLAGSGQRARTVKIFGGSIESYSSIAQYFLEISIFGTYFETSAACTGAIGLDPGGNSGSVTLHGCTVYMNNTARFVNMSTYTDCMINAGGNAFTGTAPASSYIYYLPSSGTVRLGADSFSATLPDDCRYVQTIAAASLFDVLIPKVPATNVYTSYSNTKILSSRGFTALPLTAAPSPTVTGLTVCADGSSWDPLSKAYGRPYWVIWQGDRWYPISG